MLFFGVIFVGFGRLELPTSGTEPFANWLIAPCEADACEVEPLHLTFWVLASNHFAEASTPTYAI